MKKSLESKINEFIEAYRVISDTYYTDIVEGFKNYKHFFIFKRSNEIAYAFTSDEEMIEFIDNNLEPLRNY